MSARSLLLCLGAALLLAGCAKSTKQLTLNDPALVPPQAWSGAPAAAKPQDEDAQHHSEEVVPGDPVEGLPPMPVARLRDEHSPVPPRAVAKATPADPVTTAAFMTPLATTVSYVADERDIGPAPAEEEPYLLDSGDRVRVSVFGQPNLSRVFPVDGGGFVDLPLLGTVKARGLTTYALAKEIASQLAVDLVRDPQVSVEVAAYRPFFILGEVRAAGQYPFVNGLTVEAAVAIAGGYTARANEREVRIARLVDGAPADVLVPVTDRVRPGDTIYVRERWF